MEFSTVFTVQKEFDKEAFFKQVLIKLGTNELAPADILNAKFKEVTERTEEIIVCTAKVEGVCTAAIGFDRKEPYTDYESYTEKVGDRYMTRQRPVVKYRTVTDWQPFQTSYSTVETSFTPNSAKVVSEDRILQAIQTVSPEKVVEKGEAAVDPEGLVNAKNSCEVWGQLAAVRFPGNHHKDEYYNSNTSIQQLVCFKLPCYEVVYTYDGKDYTAECYACGKMEIHAETPKKSVSEIVVVERNTEKLGKSEKTAWITFFVVLALAAVACLYAKFAWGWPVVILFLLSAMGKSISYRKKFVEQYKSLTKDISKIKTAALEAAFKQHGFGELDEASRAKLVVKDSVMTATVAHYVPPQKTGRTVWAWVLTVVLTISSLFVARFQYQNYLHSAEYVNLAVVEKTEEYLPSSNWEGMGTYRVNLVYEIKSEKLGVEYFEVKLHVFDKESNKLGTVKSSFSNVNATKGENVQLTTYVEKHNPEENDFILQLYNMDMSKLRFEFEIGSIEFSDGDYYRNPEYSRF